MIYTGQTGWLQGGEYGFIFDSTLNDFVSGELENAIREKLGVAKLKKSAAKEEAAEKKRKIDVV